MGDEDPGTGMFRVTKIQTDPVFKVNMKSHGGIYGGHLPIPDAFLESVTSKLRSLGGVGISRPMGRRGGLRAFWLGNSLIGLETRD